MIGTRFYFFILAFVLLLIQAQTIQVQGQDVSTSCEYVGESAGQRQYDCQTGVPTIADWVGYYPGDMRRLGAQGQQVNFYQFLLDKPELFKNIPEPNLAYLRQQWQQQADDLVRQIRTTDLYPKITQVQDWVIVQSYRCDPNMCVDLSVLMVDTTNQHVTVCILSLPSTLISLSSLTPALIGELEVQIFTSFPDRKGYSFSRPMKELRQEPGYVCGNPTYHPSLILKNLQMLEKNLIEHDPHHP